MSLCMTNPSPRPASPKQDLIAAAAILTHDHTQTVRDFGGERTVAVKALLTRLRLIVEAGPGGIKGPTSGTGAAARSIAFIPALDLLTDITRKSLTGAARLTPDAVAIINRTTEEAVSAYVAAALGHGDDVQGEVLTTLRSWAGAILAMTEPVNRLELPVPCPECNARSVLELSDAGEMKKAPAFVAVHGDNIDSYVTCRSCDAKWLTGQLEELGAWVRATVTEMEAAA